jgi:hypothetical protein
LCLWDVCRSLKMPFWQGKHLAGWFWRSITRFLHITDFRLLCPGNSTLCFVSSWTSANICLIRYCVLSIAVGGNTCGPILAIFMARHMLDCSCCTWPPYLVIVVDMLKSYKILVVASNKEIWLLPQPYMIP